jgi:threonine dehydratase
MKIPDFQDVLLARRQIRPYLPRTPLNSYPAIDELLGAPSSSTKTISP